MNGTLRPIALLSLALLFVGTLFACDDSEDLKDAIDAFNEADSYTLDTEMKELTTNRTSSITYRVDGRKEHVQFLDQEYYQVLEDGIMYRYASDDEGTWRREEIPETSPEDALFVDENIVRPGNVRFNWFEEGTDGYYVIKDDSKESMFDDLAEQVTYTAIKDKEDGFELIYRLENDGAPLEYTFHVRAVDQTTVELPKTGEGSS